jgi:Phosphodiester glycosidase
MCSSWLAVFVAFILLFLVAKGESDSETILYPLQIIPVPSSLTRETNLTILSPKKNSLLITRPAYAITTTEVWSVVVPGHGLERTSVQAAKNYPHCIYATNGGPFQKDGSTVGAVVTNGRIVGENFDGVGFGMGTQCDQKTIQNNCFYWVIGTVDSVAHAHALGLEQFVTGFDWLVYNGRNVPVASSNSSTELSEQAPRTAIGLTTRGHLVLLVADGCERWYVDDTLGGSNRCRARYYGFSRQDHLSHERTLSARFLDNVFILSWNRRGLRLNELAALLIQQGAMFAINLDGGSSSVMIAHNRTVSRPTCLDVLPIVCERPVASVMCIGSGERLATEWHQKQTVH